MAASPVATFGRSPRTSSSLFWRAVKTDPLLTPDVNFVTRLDRGSVSLASDWLAVEDTMVCFRVDAAGPRFVTIDPPETFP